MQAGLITTLEKKFDSYYYYFYFNGQLRGPYECLETERDETLHLEICCHFLSPQKKAKTQIFKD